MSELRGLREAIELARRADLEELLLEFAAAHAPARRMIERALLEGVEADDDSYAPEEQEDLVEALFHEKRNIWGWSYAPRRRALRELMETLSEMADQANLDAHRGRPVAAMNQLMGLVRACVDHLDFQEETELDGVLGHVFERLEEVLTIQGAPYQEVAAELMEASFHELSRGARGVHEYAGGILGTHLRRAAREGLCDRLGDELEQQARAGQRPSSWREEQVRDFVRQIGPDFVLEEHLPTSSELDEMTP